MRSTQCPRFRLTATAIRIALAIGVYFGFVLTTAVRAASYSIPIQIAGWYKNDSFHDPANLGYLTGDCVNCGQITTDVVYRSFFAFDLNGLNLVPGETISRATLAIPTVIVDTADPFETVTFYEVTTPVSQLDSASEVGSVNGQLIYTDLGDGAVYGSQDYTALDPSDIKLIPLNATARVAITSAIGGSFIIGGAMTTLDEMPNNEYVYGYSYQYEADIRLDLSTVPPLVPGDYNADGIVNAADFTVWRDHVGQTFALPNRSPDNNGPISTADYMFWKSHFGEHTGSAAGTAATVPEPSALALLAIGCVASWPAHRLRRQPRPHFPIHARSSQAIIPSTTARNVVAMNKWRRVNRGGHRNRRIQANAPLVSTRNQ
jgi:hypothetical protein